jgi:hypothetical protein
MDRKGKLSPDLRYHHRYGVCNSPGDYLDTLSERRFRHVPLWAIPVTLSLHRFA